MPFYEYRCPSCEEIFEILQKIGAESSDVKCPKCGKGECDRVLSTASVHGGSTSQGGASGGCLPQGGFS